MEIEKPVDHVMQIPQKVKRTHLTLTMEDVNEAILFWLGSRHRDRIPSDAIKVDVSPSFDRNGEYQGYSAEIYHRGSR